MLKPLTWLCLWLACICHTAKAQNAETDSLINLLQKTPADTTKVMLYWKIGASIIYQDPQASIKYFKQGVALATQLNYIPGMERCHNATSLAFSVNGKYDSALVYINYAVPFAIKAGDTKRLALAYLNRADVYANLSNYNAALKDADTAIQYAEKLKSSADALGRIYSIIAGIFTDQNNYTDALLNMDKSMGHFQKVNNRRMIAQLYSDKADVFNKLEQPAKALPLLHEAIRIGDSLQDLENLSSYYLSLAEAQARLKQYNEATQSAKQAIILCEQTGNTAQEGNAYLNLYNIENEQKNLKQATTYALKAFKIFTEQNDTLRMQAAATNLSEGYHATNNPAEAYKYLKISSDLGDSLLRKKFNQQTAELQTTFRVTEKDKEIQLLNKEWELQKQRLQKQRLALIGAAVIVLLTLTGLWLLITRNKLRQRMKELELRNQIAADLHDEVGSSLSSIHMLSQMATQKVNEVAQQDLLVRMSTNAKETMDKMGDIVWMIKPGESEAASLKQRIERFAYETGTAKNIEVQTDLNDLDKVKLTMEQRKNIYLICKEAVNNAAKYSGTATITIQAALQNKELHLIIKDEGQGFDIVTAKKGNGLDNMTNRAKDMGAKMRIQSALNKGGTTIALTMPA